MSSSPALRFFASTPMNGLGVGPSGEGALMQTLVLTFVLANLITLVIVAVFYLNMKLFGPYAWELAYAVLLSEALYTIRMRVLDKVTRVTSSRWSPRAVIMWALTSIRGYMILCSGLFFLTRAFESVEIAATVLGSVLCAFLVFDEYTLFLFRMHHFVISDEALVSFVIVFVLVAIMGVFVGSFLVLSLRDAAAAVDASAAYMNEHVLKDPLIRDRFNEGLLTGKSHITSISRYLQEQYQGTPYGPAVSLTSNLLANFTNSFGESPGEFPVWSFPDVESIKNEFLSVGISALYNGTFPVKDAFKNAADGIYLGIAVLTSVAFAFFDFGFRATFFAGVLFFLVSSPKSVLQTLMESILSVFSKAKRSNSVSSVPSDPGMDDGFQLEQDDRDRTAAFKRFEDELRNTFKAVFAVPVSLAGANAMATVTIFTAMNIFGANLNAIYFAGLLSLVFTLVPVISPFLSCVPWCVVSSVVYGKHWASVSLLIIQYLVFTMLDGYLLSALHSDANSRSPGSFRSYMTGLSFFFGISSMGLHGVVLGPLFVSFLDTTMSTILGWYRDVVNKLSHKGHRRSTSQVGQ